MNEKVEQTLRDFISAVNNLRDAVAKLTSAPGNDETRAPTRIESLPPGATPAPGTHSRVFTKEPESFATEFDDVVRHHNSTLKAFVNELLDQRLEAVKTRTRPGSILEDDPINPNVSDAERLETGSLAEEAKTGE